MDAGREGVAMNPGLILNDLANILANFQGREYSGVIDRETRFFADLGLASIDAVILAETLESYYGRKLPFAQLLADLQKQQEDGSLDGEIDFTMGMLADFLSRHLPEKRGA